MIQLDHDRRPLARAESPLSPEMRAFIDRVIAPILVKKYLSGGESKVENGISGLTHNDKYANGI
jgi:hypothetical protein